MQFVIEGYHDSKAGEVTILVLYLHATVVKVHTKAVLC